MPKTRTAAPEQYRNQVYVSERIKLEQEYDAQYPDYKHVWKSVDASMDYGGGITYEVVKDKNGNPITNKIQVLCRVPAKEWKNAQVRSSEESLSRVKSVYLNDDGTPITDRPLTVQRNPKRPLGKE